MSGKDKIRPFEQVAQIFDISRESAKYFLNHVQKSFKVERPPHQLIVEFVQSQGYEFQPTPYDVATAMKESGVWDYALGSPPPKLEDEEDLYGG
ncbi:MAG TPA: hypothetical protein PKL78_08440 [Anaerolineales bacterium]|nr:hypothetical protein [Anaerolineales bacterium]HNO31248.1 hypothetical protein [Anaerolineales bacterium]